METTIKKKQSVKKTRKSDHTYVESDVDNILSDEEIIDKNPFDKKYVMMGKRSKKNMTFGPDSETVADDYDPYFYLILDDNPFDKKHIIVGIPNKKSSEYFPNALLLEMEDEILSEQPTEPKPVVVTPQKKKVLNADDIIDLIDEIDYKTSNHSETLTDIDTDSKSDNIEGQCKYCKKVGYLIEETHEASIICGYCGVVNELMMDHGPEWRQFNDDQKGEVNGRCGAPSNFFFPKSTQGTVMTGIGSARLKRKQKWNSMVYKERSLNTVFEFIKTKCSSGGIPKSISDTAQIMYKKINDSKHKEGVNKGKQIIIRGDNRTSIIAACVFKACEMNKNPRSIREIAKIFSIDEKKVTKGNKQYEKLIKNSEELIFIESQITGNTAEDFIRRHSGKLGMTADEMNMSIAIAKNCERMKLVSDHNPQSVAAGSIYLMMDHTEYTYDKKEIAKLLETSDVTIGKIYNKMYPFKDVLIDSDMTTFFIKKFKINSIESV